MIYLQFWVDFMNNVVRTKAPHFVDLGLLSINALDEVNIFGTPPIRIIRPKYGPNWSVPDHVFGEATAVETSTTRPEQYYSFFFFFWAVLHDPIECSLLGGDIPSQNSGYKVTRLCSSIMLS